MVRSLIAMLLLIAAVLWTPLWFQCVLFVLAVVFLSKKALFVIPAIVSDVLYAPTSGLTLSNFKLTLMVSSMIVIWLIIIKQTRISHVVEA